nr:reverse transcriptase domain-containing protein [Tanacetum cinerariifolium]
MPQECLKLIESKSKVRQTRAKAVVAKVSTSSSTPAVSSKVAELKDMVRALLLDKKNQSSATTSSSTPAPIKTVNQPPAYQAPAYQAPIPQTQSVSQTDFERYVKANDAVLRNIQSQGQRSGTLPSNTITNPKEELKGITTRSGVAYQGPPIPTQSKVVKQGTEVTKDQVQNPSSQSTAPVQPPVIRSETQTSVFDPVVAPVSVPMPNLKPSIPYPSRHDNERRRDQATEQIEKFYEIFKDMSFEISFTDALILTPKFASTIKALIGNKDKLSEMAKTPMNEHCSAVILNKLPRKLGDPGKFLIPCPPEVPMADNRTMAELLQAPTEGYEDAIFIPEIAANNFELKHGLINLVQSKQFFGHDKEDPHAHIRYFNKITSTMRVPNFFPPSKMTNLRNKITRFQQRFDELFYEAWDRFIDLLMVETSWTKCPRECLKIIKRKSKVHQSRAKAVVAKVGTSSSTPAVSSEVAKLKDLVRALLLDKKNQSSAPVSSPTPASVKAVNPNCVTCGGGNFNQGQLHRPQVNQPPAYQAPIPQTQNVSNTDFKSYIKGNDVILRNMQSQGQSTQNQCQNIQNQYQNLQIQMANLTDMMPKIMSSNVASSSGSGTLHSNTITNTKEELKGITTRSGVAYQGPIIPNPPKVVKQGTEVTKDQVQIPSSQSTAPVQPPVSQSETPTLISNPVVAPVSASMPNVKSSIPYPSRRDNERCRDEANEQIEKFYKNFKDTSFKISFTDALIVMPKYASTLEALIGNKEKLSEMARTPMNEHCSAVILNKLPRKLGDPDKFLIPCEFSGMDECLVLADLANKIDVIEMACEEYSQEVFGFSDVTTSGNPTPHDDPIVSTTSPTLTSFGDSDFLLFEEANAFLCLEDDSNLPKINPFYYDPEGDILLLKTILNSEPLPSLPNHEQYFPSFKKELKVCEAKTVM